MRSRCGSIANYYAMKTTYGRSQTYDACLHSVPGSCSAPCESPPCWSPPLFSLRDAEPEKNWTPPLAENAASVQNLTLPTLHLRTTSQQKANQSGDTPTMRCFSPAPHYSLIDIETSFSQSALLLVIVCFQRYIGSSGLHGQCFALCS